MSDEKLISADALCRLTGLTDRRHRQLAVDGWFPKPLDGQYVLGKTLPGLFRYYREQLAKKETSAYDEARTRLANAQADIAEVDRAERRNLVLPVEAILATWQNIAAAWRRVILTSKLSHAEQDALLAELKAATTNAIVEQAQSQRQVDPDELDDTPEGGQPFMIDRSTAEKVRAVDKQNRIAAIKVKLEKKQPLTASELRLVDDSASGQIYGSMAACAAGESTTVDVVKWVKKEGCPAFRANGNIHADEFRAWMLVNRDRVPSGKTLRDEKLTEEIRKLRIDNDARAGLLVSKAKQDEDTIKASKGLQSILWQVLVNELPPNMSGQDIPATRILCQNAYDKVMRDWKRRLLPELAAQIDESPTAA